MKEIRISYAITVCDEYEEFKNLLSILTKHKRSDDEICVLLDSPKANNEFTKFLHHEKSQGNIVLRESSFQGHFAKWKNELMSMCNKDYVVNIDADEYPNVLFLENIHQMIADSSVDVMYVPRVNTVEGITESHVSEWGWHVNKNGWINFPDYQCRVIKNTYPHIKWENQIHEVPIGFKTFARIPAYEELSFYHQKHISKQERQNKLYTELVNG